MTVCPLCQAQGCSQIWRKNGHDLYLCPQCDLIFVHPLPTPQQLADLYCDGYHGWMEKLGQGESALSPQDKIELDKLTAKAQRCLGHVRAHLPNPGRILDVGCTAGFFLKAAQAVGWEVEGVELNPLTAQVACDLLGAKVHNQPVGECQLPQDNFDAVTSWDVIEHLSEPRKLLEAAWQTLKPGGLLFLSTPDHRGLFPRLSLSLAPLTKTWPHPTPPWHCLQFSLATLKWLLQEQGFILQRVYHSTLDLEEGFGSWRVIATNPKYLAYFLALGWSALLGPALGMGDMLHLVAAKPQ